MSSTVETLTERVLNELHRIIKTETVVGNPVKAGDLTLIPVSKISFGFGAGSGQKEGKGQSGTGGGASVEPIAFVVINADGEVQILPLHEKEPGLGHLVELVPEVLAKVRKFVGKKKNKEEDVQDSEGKDREPPQ